MNYNFTDRVRNVLAMAREEAVRLQHDYVGTEHILLGLLREGEGVAVAALYNAQIDIDQVREMIEETVRPGKRTIALGELPYTSRAKKTLEYAMETAREFKHQYVGTEHLLIGLIREEKGIAAQVLASLGMTLAIGLNQVGQLLGRDGHVQVTVAGSGWTGYPPLSAFQVRVDDNSNRSIYEQIIDQVQEAVATGLLLPGARLQPVRQLADLLDIAPGTVARAYSELERRGVVVTQGARGTRVAPRAESKQASTERLDALTDLLRPVAVAAFHMGASSNSLRAALDKAMTGIFDGSSS